MPALYFYAETVDFDIEQQRLMGYGLTLPRYQFYLRADHQPHSRDMYLFARLTA